TDEPGLGRFPPSRRLWRPPEAAALAPALPGLRSPQIRDTLLCRCVRIESEFPMVEMKRDWQPYVRAWRRRLAAEEDARRVAAEEARAAARRCAQILVARVGVRRVILFGSLTGRGAAPFGLRSDVDLAVEG